MRSQTNKLEFLLFLLSMATNQIVGVRIPPGAPLKIKTHFLKTLVSHQKNRCGGFCGVHVHASRRAGVLHAEMEKRGEIAGVGQPKKPKTLPELGITRDQSSTVEGAPRCYSLPWTQEKGQP